MSASHHTEHSVAGAGLMDTTSRFALTFFKTYGATSKRDDETSLDALAAHIEATTASEKTKLPWLKLAKFGNARTENHSLRHDANVLSITGIEADYDAEVMTFEEAVEIATKQGLLALIYTSPRHTEDRPRWRVLCPLSQPVLATDRGKMLGRLNGLYRGIFSGESWTVSQSYYYGSVGSNPSHRVEVIDGTSIDLHDDLDVTWLGKPNTGPSKGTASEPRSGVLNETELLDQITGGESYHEAKIRLLGRWAYQGVPMMEARSRLINAFEAVFPPDRDARWSARREDVDRCLEDIYIKEARKKDARGDQPAAGSHSDKPDNASAYARLRTINPVALLDKPVPQRRWIVDRWLPIPSVTLLYADGGVGKTQLAQQLMTSGATSTPWLGLRVEPCRSFALFCEDDEDELHRRQDAINLRFGIGYDELEAMRWASGTGEDNVLIRFEPNGSAVMTERFEDLISQAKEHRARLLIIDTAADTFGGSENDRGQVRQFIGNALSRAAREIDGAVLVNAHPSRTGLSTGNLDGGSTGWSNSARSRWSLQRPVDEDGREDLASDERIMTRRKANYASVGDTIRLRWVDGVMMPADAGETVYTSAARRSECELMFLELLRRADAEGRPVSHSKNAANFAPKRFAKVPDAAGHSQKDFERAMEVLFSAGKIEVRDYGKPSDNTRKIAAVNVESDGSEEGATVGDGPEKIQ